MFVRENKWIVNIRQRYDLEMLLTQGFNPLTGFLSQADYQNVLNFSRLENNQLWPLPIVLDVNEKFAASVNLGEDILLCDSDNSVLASMKVTDKWQPDKKLEAKSIFATEDLMHPGVNYLFNSMGSWYLGGPVQAIQIPKHYDFVGLRHTPRSLKQLFFEAGHQRIVGFQTRNPMHRAHMELTLRAAKEYEAHILLHPVVGVTKPGDVDHYTRVRCYQTLLNYYPAQAVTLSLLPLAMRMAGPKEALWHAIIRKNYGCTHFIVGRDHAGPGNDSANKPFYDPYAAQDLVMQYQEEIGINIIPFQEMVYVKERKQYCLANEVKQDETTATISGTQLRQALVTGNPVPEWFSFPAVMRELYLSYPPRHKQGFTLFFTGLSGAGKTTIANALIAKLKSIDTRSTSLLDGDIVRRVLATELGFSKADRDLNVRRIGFVAAEITKAGGVALCAAIAPYQDVRNECRQLISQYGGYIEVFISTSLAVCEQRDTKGLYAKARKGEMKGLTGVDDPYEKPVNPEIIIDTAVLDIDGAIKKIVDYLQAEGYLHSTQMNPLYSLPTAEKGADGLMVKQCESV